MPGPAIIGLTALGAFLGRVLVAFVGWFGAYVTKKVALTVAAIAAFAVLATGIVVTLDTLLGNIVSTFPIAANIGFIAPDGFSTTLGYYFAFRISYWVYSVNWLIIRMRLL